MPQIQDEYRFIELNRSFYELREDSIESDSLLARRALQSGTRLSWADLAQEHRVIILSEAGTGKTEEIRHLAETMREDGKAAFFLRLEHIPNDFDDAFEVGSVEEFRTWLASGDEGWVLLDSVDEAKLRHPGDFELAVKKVGRRNVEARHRRALSLTQVRFKLGESTVTVSHPCPKGTHDRGITGKCLERSEKRSACSKNRDFPSETHVSPSKLADA